MPRRTAVFFLLFFSLLGVWALAARSVQAQAPASERRVDPQFGDRRNGQDDFEERMERTRLKNFNKSRHESLKKDTDRLLELSTELKQYVDKTDENQLSLDVIRKAEEIEKLAKDVRQKMKSYYIPTKTQSP